MFSQTLPVPISNRMDLAAAFAFSTVRPLNCIPIGDSRFVPGSTGGSNFGRGMHRAYPIPIVGRFIHGVGGLNPWGGVVEQITTGTVSQQEGTPGSTFLDGAAADFAVSSSWMDAKFTGNVVGNGFGQPCMWAGSLYDLANYPLGNWTAGKDITADIIFNGNAAGLTGVTAEGARGQAYYSAPDPATGGYPTANAGAGGTAALNMTTPTGVRTVRVKCGSHASAPPYARLLFGSGDETNKVLQVGGCMFHDPAATSGMLIGGSLGTGGYTMAETIKAFGGASPTCTNANARATISALAPLMANAGAGGYIGFIVEHNNLSATEATEFASAGFATYLSGRRTFCDLLDAHCIALYGRPADFIWFRVPWVGEAEFTSYALANRDLRARALYQLSVERANVCYDALSGFQLGGTSADLAGRGRDILCSELVAGTGLHPSGGEGTSDASVFRGNGDVVWARASWDALAMTDIYRNRVVPFRTNRGR